MKNLIFLATACLIMVSCSDSDRVKIVLPDDYSGKTLVVSHLTIENLSTATHPDDLNVVYDTLDVKNGVAEMKLDPAGASRYNIASPFSEGSDAEFYASPGDRLEVTIRSFMPLDYAVKGTELMEDITAFSAATAPIEQEYFSMFSAGGEISEELMEDILARYESAVRKFVADNPESPAVPFVILQMSDDDAFKKAYENLTPEAKKSILMPFAELHARQIDDARKEREADERRRTEMAEAKNDAPDFTLPDIDGRKVSLSDFRGKWVVLDFWGSWCGWCVKGFPALKDAYSEYGDRIAVIGIDCNESEEDWRSGVRKYQLPWLNLYNGHNTELYEAYGIQGFPTKAIINPEGKLVDLTIGEDPAFFTRLASFLDK